MNKEKIPPRYFPEIDPEQCKGCGKCVYSCPKKILKAGDNINSYGFRYVVCVEDSCVGCGNCFYSCPEPGAIIIYSDDGEDEGEKSRK
jgi:NAD-dependent dihydropyrimidine dehydrogenase PreA subunit